MCNNLELRDFQSNCQIENMCDFTRLDMKKKEKKILKKVHFCYDFALSFHFVLQTSHEITFF